MLCRFRLAHKPLEVMIGISPYGVSFLILYQWPFMCPFTLPQLSSAFGFSLYIHITGENCSAEPRHLHQSDCAIWGEVKRAAIAFSFRIFSLQAWVAGDLRAADFADVSSDSPWEFVAVSGRSITERVCSPRGRVYTILHGPSCLRSVFSSASQVDADHEPNQIPPMKSSRLQESIIGTPRRSVHLPQPEISAWERLQFKRRTFHKPNWYRPSSEFVIHLLYIFLVTYKQHWLRRLNHRRTKVELNSYKFGSWRSASEPGLVDFKFRFEILGCYGVYQRTCNSWTRDVWDEFLSSWR